MAQYGCERVILCHDRRTGLRGAIAVHSTLLGPAVGGLRMWTYPEPDDAILDAMRLARAMTYKYAAAGVDLGGGKAVIAGDPARDKSPALLRAMGRFIDQLRGDYLVGQDVGTTLADMEVLFDETPYVMTLPEHSGGAGEIAPATARGAVQAIRACVERVFGSADLAGRSVALQGLGNVGGIALRLLREAGASVVVTDVDAAKVEAAVAGFGVTAVAPDEIYDREVDVFAPFALGGVIGDDTVTRLKAPIVCGAANNQLRGDRVLETLDARGITWGVDYIANAGGAIWDADRLRTGGFRAERAGAAVDRIADRMREVFAIADAEGISVLAAGDQLAQRRLTEAGHRRLLGRGPSRLGL
ncbi:Glu/Leu/Phe/Val family dehydrogenase [Dactylosporangium sp. CA-139114]|uniref:Glu/Leu/Phe/Val family dehydrogenase n=1 Tax=Dactylosporangium sp. CA-139114 TaxID=3239931 RepID=UPI003D99F636